MGQLAPVFYIIAKETADRQDDSQILAGVNQAVDRMTGACGGYLLQRKPPPRCSGGRERFSRQSGGKRPYYYPAFLLK